MNGVLRKVIRSNGFFLNERVRMICAKRYVTSLPVLTQIINTINFNYSQLY